MSVAVYSNEELAAVRAKLLMGADPAIVQAIDDALLAAAIANRAAYQITYGEAVAGVIAFREAEPDTTWNDWNARTHVGNLIYNCVSNGGRCFLPESDCATLERAAQEAEARAEASRRAERAAQVAQSPAPYKGTVERAAEIRASLKARAWSGRKVSVRAELYSMGSTIHVTIKDRTVPMSVVEDLARAHEHVDRDETGDILGGGNLFVSVGYSRDVIEPLAAELLAEIPEDGEAVVRGFRVWSDTTDRGYYWIDREDWDRPRKVCDRRYVAEQLATLILG